MTNGIDRQQQAQQTHCEVCGDPISQIDVLLGNMGDTAVCRSIDCRQVMSQKESLLPVLFQPYLEFNKNRIRQARALNAARKKHIETVRENEQQENQAILHAVLDGDAELSAQDVQLLDIPSGKTGSKPLARERLEKYTAHLTQIIREAAGYNNASEVVYGEHHAAHEKIMQVEQRFEENPALHAICDRLCAMCKGGCCVKGDEHAYLSVFSIRQYMDDHPELTAEMLRDRYLSCIVSESIEDACINQTVTGCALPRELRSDICNGYFCDTIKLWQKELAGEPITGPLLVVQRACTNWNRFEADVANEVVDVVLVDGDGQEVTNIHVASLQTVD